MEVYGSLGKRPRAIDAFFLFRPVQSWHQASEGTSRLFQNRERTKRLASFNLLRFAFSQEYLYLGEHSKENQNSNLHKCHELFDFVIGEQQLLLYSFQSLPTLFSQAM